MTVILTRCGSKVRCCESTAEALKTFREWKPDLLVSDIGMPKEDGYALIKKLRKLRLKRALNRTGDQPFLRRPRRTNWRTGQKTMSPNRFFQLMPAKAELE